MTTARQLKWARLIVSLVTGALLSLAFTGCKSQESFAVMKFQASSEASGTAAPSVMGRTDGDLLVAWGAVYVTCSVEPKGGGFPFYFVTVPAGKIVVLQRSDKFKWEGDYPSVMPARAAALFTAPEIAAWGLSFAEPQPIDPPGDTVPSPVAASTPAP